MLYAKLSKMLAGLNSSINIVLMPSLLYLRRYILFLFFRFVYIRYASGLVRDGAKLFHIIVIVFLSVWLSIRIMNIHFVQLWRRLDFKEYPIGKICMMTPLSLTYEGKIDENFDFFLKKVKIANIMSFSISIVILIYGSFSSFRDRYIAA